MRKLNLALTIIIGLLVFPTSSQPTDELNINNIERLQTKPEISIYADNQLGLNEADYERYIR